MKPATVLPWSHQEDRRGRIRIFGPNGIEVARALWKSVKTKEQRDQNRAYIAHACNAYPALVAALRESQQHLDARPEDTGLDIIRQRNAALLRSLGESA